MLETPREESKHSRTGNGKNGKNGKVSLVHNWGLTTVMGQYGLLSAILRQLPVLSNHNIKQFVHKISLLILNRHNIYILLRITPHFDLIPSSNLSDEQIVQGCDG